MYYWNRFKPGCCSSCGIEYPPSYFQTVAGSFDSGDTTLSSGGVITATPTPLSDYGYYDVFPKYKGRTYHNQAFDIVYGGQSFTLRHVAGDTTQSVYFGNTLLGTIGYVTNVDSEYTKRISEFGNPDTATGYVRWTPWGNYMIHIPYYQNYVDVGPILVTPIHHANYRPGIKNTNGVVMPIDMIQIIPQYKIGTTTRCASRSYCPEISYDHFCRESFSIDVAGFSGFAATQLNRRWTLHRKAAGTMGIANQWESETITYVETVQVKATGTDANGIRMVYFPNDYGGTDIEDMDIPITFQAKITGNSGTFLLLVSADPVVLGTNRTSDPYPNSPNSSTNCTCVRRNIERMAPMTTTSEIGASFSFGLQSDPYATKNLSAPGDISNGGYFYYQNGTLLPGTDVSSSTIYYLDTYYKFGYCDDTHDVPYTQSCSGGLPDKTCTKMSFPRNFRRDQLVHGFKNSFVVGQPTAKMVEG